MDKKNYKEKEVDVVVVGAGHAGCEAALACARMGLETVLFTVSVDGIAMMPCNPNVGGTSKGHLVREVDALGGEMGKNIDKTFIQSRMLNRSKGPAVHSLRAQADKAAYSREMRKTLENTPGLYICQSEVSQLLTEEVSTLPKTILYETDDTDDHKTDSILPNATGSTVFQKDNESDQSAKQKNRRITGIRTVSGAIYHCKAVVLCTGTYLRARCIYGEVSNPTGPNGLQAANHLTDSLLSLGIRMNRFKTGTPARMDGRTLDYSRMEPQYGDEPVIPFSFETDPATVQKPQVCCYLTYTNEETHQIIRENLDRSPLFSGMIEGTGPRYCPSIEDKVVRFADKEKHQVFIEPEGLDTNEMYIGGMSSSLPEDVQEAMYHTVPGLEHAHIVKNAYAIEYDCIDATQLTAALEFKQIRGLFSAGQFNGSSGYEEAAAQGIIAGINAALQIRGEEPLILNRSDGYIGVLIDDLVTKVTHEPYRMMTSRSEYRLLQRQDNADRRLTPYGYRVGLISKERYDRLIKKEELIEQEVHRLETTQINSGKEIQQFLENNSSTILKTSATLAELIRRPELDYEQLSPIDPKRPKLPENVKEQVNIQIKYAGYIRRQQSQVEQFLKNEKQRIPETINYDEVKSLRKEARQKLKEIRPANIGQASRISGVSPADISVLLIYLCAKRGGSQDL